MHPLAALATFPLLREGTLSGEYSPFLASCFAPFLGRSFGASLKEGSLIVKGQERMRLRKESRASRQEEGEPSSKRDAITSSVIQEGTMRVPPDGLDDVMDFPCPAVGSLDCKLLTE